VYSPVAYVFAETHDANGHRPHLAPCPQYVVTIKDKLRFLVRSGDTFIIEPGVVLVAKDVRGPGHSWDLTEGETWEWFYLPFAPEVNDHFMADT
jgi:hypothetical protein